MTMPARPKAELRRRLARALDIAGDLAYAIGGADAMAAHGYVRATRDIDIFTVEEHVAKLLHALRQAGLEVSVVQEPSHFAARLPRDPVFERRIDVLVTWGEPELSAVEYAVTLRRFGREWRFFPVDLLAFAKFEAYVDSGDPRHALDLLAMIRRGLFSVPQVRAALASVFPDEVARWDETIASFATKGRGRTQRRGPRLPRGGS